VTTPKLLALDFDGVICNSVYEGLLSAWRVCRDLWALTGDGPSPEIRETFARLRPALEIGWEFPVMVRAILDGIPEEALLGEFQTKWCQQILEKYRLDKKDLTGRFDATRDAWISSDLESWLRVQHFYEGVAARLRAVMKSPTQVWVITTKEGKYAQLLLERNGVSLQADRVWGKEHARPKAEVLTTLHRDLGVAYPDIWFVEDRLKTLHSVEQRPDLADVCLFLATWGYNTPAEQAEAAADPRIHTLSLSQFCADFPAWLSGSGDPR
jgi:phosphoglycolate phosphatase-like HAD superfamily hydrolase